MTCLRRPTEGKICKRHEPITAVGSWAWQFGHRRRHAIIVVAARDSPRLVWAGIDACGSRRGV